MTISILSDSLTGGWSNFAIYGYHWPHNKISINARRDAIADYSICPGQVSASFNKY